MTFYIYNPVTKHRYTRGPSSGQFDSEGGAKASLTALKKREKGFETYAVISADEFFKQDLDIIVISMMNGKQITIKQSQKGNPAVDPSMEGYWSM